MANALSEEKHILCEKTPRHLHKIESIKTALPDSKFVVVTRDAKDTVFSMKNRSGDFKASLARWKTDNQVVLENIDKKNILLVRYEELIEQQEDTVKSICKFIGVDFEHTMFDYNTSGKTWFGLDKPKETDGKGEANHVERRAWQMTQPIHDRRGIWKGKLKDEEVEIIEDQTKEIMRALGYK